MTETIAFYDKEQIDALLDNKADESDIDDIQTDISALNNDIDDIEDSLSGYQEKLISGINIKTINGNSLLGAGNIPISGGTSGITYVLTSILER